MFAIKSETKWGTSWVNANVDGYQSLGKCPTIFADKAAARRVINQYKDISANSGKKPSPMKIVPFGELV